MSHSKSFLTSILLTPCYSYLGGYVFLVVLMLVVFTIAQIGLALGTISSARTLHRRLVDNVLGTTLRSGLPYRWCPNLSLTDGSIKLQLLELQPDVRKILRRVRRSFVLLLLLFSMKNSRQRDT